jgi:hypothetical protein
MNPSLGVTSFLDQIVPELWRLVQEAVGYSAYQERLTVFDSTGWSLEDQVAGQMLIDPADVHDLGQTLRLERITRDPLNPYDVEVRTRLKRRIHEHSS